MERHLIQGDLKEKLTNYWGDRAFSQLMYLEEMNAVSDDAYCALLEECTTYLARQHAQDGAITKQAALRFEEMLAVVSDAAKATTVTCVAHGHPPAWVCAANGISMRGIPVRYGLWRFPPRGHGLRFARTELCLSPA